MKQDTLTPVEKQVLKGCATGEWADIAQHLARRKNWSRLRAMMRSTAYHEAGHVAARMFTGLEPWHVVHVSIIPDAKTTGRERSERNFAEVALAHYPPPLMRCAGRSLLLGMLAGRGAEARVAAPDDREDILDDDALWMQGEDEGTDLFRAMRIADTMARPGMPAHRVLNMAARWTEEMLALPDVWRCVETLAGMLIERGIIEDKAEIMAACEPILDGWMKLPTWKRRLSFTKAEMASLQEGAQ